MPYKNPEDARRYREANREKLAARTRAYHAEHKDDPEYRARRKDYNERWRTETNRPAHLAIKKRSYEANKPARQADARERMAKRRAVELPILLAIVSEAKSVGCSECSEARDQCLDFHHRNPLEKSFDIGKEIQRLIKPQVLLDEIAKCDVFCNNCHQKHHSENPSPLRKRPTPAAERGRRYREKRKAKWGSFIERCRADGCTLCPELDHLVLQFHHVDPLAKVFAVMGYVLQRIGVDLAGEVEKCMVLCANCHRCVEAGVATLPDIPLDAYWANRLEFSV